MKEELLPHARHCDSGGEFSEGFFFLTPWSSQVEPTHMPIARVRACARARAHTHTHTQVYKLAPGTQASRWAQVEGVADPQWEGRECLKASQADESSCWSWENEWQLAK